MKILVFNCGSSSLKYRLIDMPGEKELAGGEAERVGPPTAKPSRIVHRQDGTQSEVTIPMPTHSAAFQQVMLLLKQADCSPDIIAHRVVHGGETCTGTVVVTPELLSALDYTKKLAPIHNPPSLGLVKDVQRLLPDIPQVAVFDTAYHATIPAYAYTYALPRDLCRELHIRKYGFHGTSHAFVAEEAARKMGVALENLQAVSCHLGSGGASLCAIVNGKSVDNTMGFSPLQGLVMSTRCGDLDPAVALQLLRNTLTGSTAVEQLLNRHCGVLGLSGLSADIRDVLAGSADEPRLAETVKFYIWRIRKHLGAYLAVIDQPQAIIFTDTIGETVPAIRQAICENLPAFGVRIDSEKNRLANQLPVDIASPDSAVRILVIRTNEELAIARETFRLCDDSSINISTSVKI